MTTQGTKERQGRGLILGKLGFNPIRIVFPGLGDVEELGLAGARETH